MKKNIIVLGAGLVGKAIAQDLSKKYDVTSADIDERALDVLSSNDKIHTIQADLSKSEIIKSVIKDFDLVVGALPGFMGYETIKNVIEEKKDIVDISFFPEDPFLLDELAKSQNVTAITDCGVAPGMSNIILGYHNERMTIENYKCFVGGLPVERVWPFEYKAVFSPIDVIEEYTRPARFIEGGKLVVKEALTDPEIVFFEEIGQLEAWNSDGLRTLMKTFNIPNMIEKTLRYPGSIEYIKVLRDCGFFSYEEVEVNNNKIRPIDLTSKLLFPKWELKPGEEDFTVMKVIVGGLENGHKKSYVYDLYDKFDDVTKTTSMARTTGYTCTAAVNLLLEEDFSRKGICPPEYLGSDEKNFNFILDYLKERGIVYKVS
ncbi:MAG: saccharopine dehydrogenase NADP-binding domain-containing protein [Ignavibacteria bacterium]|nr:saccharopine dehydrogenase NADP-binding domain-containing protein [Ignavibacteria bacterium]